MKCEKKETVSDRERGRLEERVILHRHNKRRTETGLGAQRVTVKWGGLLEKRQKI